jgi:protoheme IX farnesyltransferase
MASTSDRAATPPTLLDGLADLAVLLKPRIASFVFLAALVGGWLALGRGAELWPLAEAALWITCTAGAASVFNQVLERDTDARMERTRHRPLPAGRIGVGAAIGVGAGLAALGTAGLALRFDPLAAVLALLTLLTYALVYTPLKRVTTFNTLVGALPGAMPPLLGHVAATGEVGVWGAALFALLFVWQFPHFLAIAWIYREDYARAGLRMLPSVPGTVGMAGRQALLYCLPILPVAMLPAWEGEAGWIYVLASVGAGLAYLAASLAFALRENAANARRLLRTSLVYLPVLLAVAVLDRLVAVGS